MPLPIEPTLPRLRTVLAEHPFAVLEAPPGAGKTTVVPLALLAEPWLAGRRIVMLEPRRLAARAAAQWMAGMLHQRVGETVGYRMRGDSRVSARTRVEVVTEGILTRMLREDLSLPGVGLVIFDEFHERSLIGDTGLALTLASMESLRDDLRVLVMSATLDGDAVATLWPGAPVLRSEGRLFPVATRHAPSRASSTIEAHIAGVVRDVIAGEAGSVLVFLPGAGEIRRVESLLRSRLPPGVSVRPLFGTLGLESQDAAIGPPRAGERKVVLATSIAETSLTIEGVRVVVDSGLMRVPRFSPRTGMTRLETTRVSRASADQRRGRAGRTEPGICIRCWSAADDAGLVPFTRPEILDADLAPLALDLASVGFADPGELRWLDAPPPAAFTQARALLRLLGAIDERGRIMPHGEAMAAVGAQPRIAEMILRARAHGRDAVELVATIAALLEERDPLRGDGGAPPSDIQFRLDGIRGAGGDALLHGATLDRWALDRIRESRRRYLDPGSNANDGVPVDAGLALAWAYPDRIGRHRDAPGRFLLRNGRGAMLPVHDSLAHVEWIVAAAIDDSGRDGRITLAAELDIDAYLAGNPAIARTEERVAWDAATTSVQARRRTMLGALTLREVAIGQADAEAVRAAMMTGIAQVGIRDLPWSAAAAAFRQRLAFVHRHDAAWPDVSEVSLVARLDQWLGPDLDGVRRLDQLAALDFAEALRRLLTWEQRRDLDLVAPERFAVPSGSMIRFDYSDPDTPLLAVRLQEVFGLLTTPSLMRGRVPVTLQLLSPAYRPVQVTGDLASFWATGYFEVRKDLRGRYPKHHWPDDPLAAAPVRGAKRRTQ